MNEREELSVNEIKWERMKEGMDERKMGNIKWKKNVKHKMKEKWET